MSTPSRLSLRERSSFVRSFPGFSRFFQGISLVFRGFCLAIPVFSIAEAHEFWIEPVDFTVAQGEKIEAQNRIGQMLKGDPHPFIASTFVRFTLTDSAGTRDVEGALGDRPALQVMPERDGLHIAAYQSTVSTLTYREAEKFQRFVSKEGLDGVLAAHAARGLPETGFAEGYTRFAKALVAVGEGRGADKALGLRFELVALSNPYTDAGPTEVQLLQEGAPAPDIQVAVFRRDGTGTVTREVMRTGADGRARIERRGAALVLVSAVTMVEPREALAARKGVVWHSLWASLSWGL